MALLYSQLNGRQRAALNVSAQWKTELVKGKVTQVTAKGEIRKRWAADNDRPEPHASIIRSTRAAERDADYHRERNALPAMLEAASRFAGKVKHIKPGRARGANELTRQRAGALNMQFYRNGGSF